MGEAVFCQNVSAFLRSQCHGFLDPKCLTSENAQIILWLWHRLKALYVRQRRNWEATHHWNGEHGVRRMIIKEQCPSDTHSHGRNEGRTWRSSQTLLWGNRFSFHSNLYIRIAKCEKGSQINPSTATFASQQAQKQTRRRDQKTRSLIKHKTHIFIVPLPKHFPVFS